MIGLMGRAETAIAPEGTIFVRGELWKARSKMNVARGESVRVTGMDGLTLDVQAEMHATVIPTTASAPDD
jgi:membrane-bound serine protease (ClpP class)